MTDFPPDKARPAVAIVGCGAIGGVVASYLARKRHPISICTTNEEVRRVWATTGPYLKERLVSFPLPKGKILSEASDSRAPFDLVFVAVPPPQIENVARSISPSLTENGRVVCLSNGWCEPRLADVLGSRRVMGAVVTWGARMPRPGHYSRTSKGGFIVGPLSGGWDEYARYACELLETVGPVEKTDNLKGARMSKLVINCAVSGLGTIGGTVLGELLVRRDVRRIGIALISEAIEVARADGCELSNVVGIDWKKWSAEGTANTGRMAQHALLMAVGLRYRHLRSSILASIERGRPPAIDYINGEISSLGRKVGVATPYNDAVVDTVWKIAKGKLMAGPSALAELIRLAHATESTRTPRTDS